MNGDRVLIDPLNSMFGKVSYNEKGIVVEDNPVTKRCMLPCEAPEEITMASIIARMEYYRSDEGIFNLLRAGQSYYVSDFHTAFIFYDPKRQVLELQLRCQLPFLEPEYHSERNYLTKNGQRAYSQELGIYEEANWAELIGREPFWRITKFFNGDEDSVERVEKFPLKARGKRYLLNRLLYNALIKSKYSDMEEDEIADSDLFLFDNGDIRETSLDTLLMRIEKLKKSGISTENKGKYNDLLKSYFEIISKDHLAPLFMQRLLDLATLKILVETSANIHKVDPITVYKRLLKENNIDETEIGNLIIWDPFYGLNREQVFPFETLSAIFERFNSAGLLK